jgi:anti-sigma factor RsiW
MTCREATDFLMDYVAGDLAVEVRIHFTTHLTGCSPCHEFLAQYLNTIEAGRRACKSLDAEAAIELPDDLVRAIVASIRAADV